MSETTTTTEMRVTGVRVSTAALYETGAEEFDIDWAASNRQYEDAILDALSRTFPSAAVEVELVHGLDGYATRTTITVTPEARDDMDAVFPQMQLEEAAQMDVDEVLSRVYENGEFWVEAMTHPEA